MQTIGFVGLGRMGGNMAARYLEAGYTVYGEARNRGAAGWLIDKGLQWVDTPRELAGAVDVVMTSLPDDDVVESVASGPDGLIAGLGEGKVWADLSTISPRASRDLAARVRGEGSGGDVVRPIADAQGHPARPRCGKRAPHPAAVDGSRRRDARRGGEARLRAPRHRRAL